MTPKIKDYAIPDGASWTDPACPGAVGSKPNLTNIQAQLEENQHALRENRKAQALAIPCPWCSNYHILMQPPVKELIGGESTDDFKEDVPSPVKEVAVDPDTVTAAIAASLGSKSEEDYGLDGLFDEDKSGESSSGVQSKSTKSNSGSPSSSASSR